MQSKFGQSGSTPFDQIAALEMQETARVEKERAAMEVERNEVREALSKKEQQAEAQMKNEARAELQEYCERDITKIIKSAEGEEAKATKKLEMEYEEKAPAVINGLVEQCTSKTSPLFLAS